MKVLNSSLFLFLVLISGYARSQCTNLRFTLTSGNAWPTVNPLPGNPQRICLQQNLASAGATVRVYTSAPVAISGVTWTVLGTGISKVAPENSQECGFRTNTPGAPFDFGKARVVVRYTAGLCGCIDTLDIFRQMNPAATSSFAPIQGPTCLAPGQKGQYYIDPRFTRPSNIALGIGLDAPYDWTISGAGTGTWSFGPLSSPALIASGDRSSLEIQAPSSLTWTAATATLNVRQGPTCNSTLVPFTISKGNPPATIVATPPGGAYVTVAANQTYVLPTNSAQSITLTAPVGAVTPYSWTKNQSLNYSLAVSGPMNETCVVTPNSGNLAQAGRITLTSPGCSGSAGTSAFVEIRRSLSNTPTAINTVIQPTTCRTAGTSFNLSVGNAPVSLDGATSTYSWTFSPASSLWSITAGQGTSAITAVAQANAPSVTFSVTLNGGTSISGAPIFVTGNAGVSLLTVPALTPNGDGTYNCSITTGSFSSNPGGCGANNLSYSWSLVSAPGAALVAPNNACGARSMDIGRSNPLNAIGSGTLSVTVTSPNCPSCALQCFTISGSRPFTGLARPSNGGNNSEKSLQVNKLIDHVRVAPNPNSGEFNVLNSEFESGDMIEIISLEGKILMSKEAEGASTKISIKDKQSGMLILKYTSKEASFRFPVVLQ